MRALLGCAPPSPDHYDETDEHGIPRRSHRESNPPNQPPCKQTISTVPCSPPRARLQGAPALIPRSSTYNRVLLGVGGNSGLVIESRQSHAYPRGGCSARWRLPTPTPPASDARLHVAATAPGALPHCASIGPRKLPGKPATLPVPLGRTRQRSGALCLRTVIPSYDPKTRVYPMTHEHASTFFRGSRHGRPDSGIAPQAAPSRSGRRDPAIANLDGLENSSW